MQPGLDAWVMCFAPHQGRKVGNRQYIHTVISSIHKYIAESLFFTEAK